MPILTTLSEDIWVTIVCFLEPPDILRLAETCKAMQALASMRVVWIQAAEWIISRGYPFPDGQINDISTVDLVKFTTRGFLLGKRWHAGLSYPRSVHTIVGTSGMSISDLRFIRGHGESLVAILAKSVWSNLSIWDISGRMISEWSPRGSIFTGFCVNSERRSEATIAVSLFINEQHLVKVLTLTERDHILAELGSMVTSMVPVTLTGNFIALSDDKNQILIWDWRSDAYALLQHSTTIGNFSSFQSNHCGQVLFVSNYIFVARARSLHLFSFPNLSSDRSVPAHELLGQHSFGWVDSQCMSTYGGSVSILIRGEIDDPWASTPHNLELFKFTVSTNGDAESDTATFTFPPQLIGSVASLHGPLRCKRVVLGRMGTALWVQPRDRSAAGLLADTQQLLGNSPSCEALVAVAFSSALIPESGGETSKAGKIYENQTGNDWSAFDYDEAGGRVAIASNFGPVQILYL